MRKLSIWQRLYLPEILRGMLVTTRHFWVNVLRQRHTVTQQYPEKPTYVSERYRGRHRLTRKEDGSPRCTACMLCATSCPALCIHIVAAEHDDPTVEKHPASFTIDELRCVFCGLCVEGLPLATPSAWIPAFSPWLPRSAKIFIYPRELLLGDGEPENIAEGKAPAH